MKKTILFLMALLMTSLAFGQLAEVSSTFLGNHTLVDEADANTVSDGTDIFMLGGDGTDAKWYDVSEGISYISNVSLPQHYTEQQSDCVYYSNDDKIYCVMRISGVGSDQMTAIKMDKDFTNYEYLTNYTGTGSTGIFYADCDLRPDTDEIWCANFRNYGTAQAGYDGIYKYDIGDDTWTFLANVNPYAEQVTYHKCSFRDSDELWCIGGYLSVSGDGTDDIFIYYVSTNTSDFTKSFGKVVNYMNCNWFDDIIYCYTGYYDEDPDECNSDIYYYDPSTDTAGNITDVMPADVCFSDCAQLDSDTVICLAGYETPSWDYYMGIFSIDFVSTAVEEEVGLEPYEPMHTTGDVVGVVTDFAVEFGIQAIALAGIIALVGLGIWIRGRLK